jgi:hypothetical protein
LEVLLALFLTDRPLVRQAPPPVACANFLPVAREDPAKRNMIIISKREKKQERKGQNLESQFNRENSIRGSKIEEGEYMTESCSLETHLQIKVEPRVLTGMLKYTSERV